MADQDQTFLQGEANRWFQRNKSKITAEDQINRDPVLRLMELMSVVPVNVLEVGASNGYRLNAIKARYGCSCSALEPSEEAIADGRSRYPGVTFFHGTASRLPFDNSEFDLVIVNFVFHWIDRSMLLRSVAEIDRVITDGGFVVIGDFYPTCAGRVFYHHLPEDSVWTYKQDYPAIFVSSNMYELVSFITVDSDKLEFQPDVNPDERTYVALLRKNLNGCYKVLEHTTQ